MNITIPQTYEELSEQQRGALCRILLTLDNTEKTPLRIIQILLSHLPKRTQQQLLLQVPFTTLWQYAEPFLTTEKLYHFREVTKMVAPAPRLANLTIKQFSVADSLYYRLRLSQYQDELLLRQLMASLYNFAHQPFDVLNLPQVAEHTDKTPITTAYEVAFAYTCCREYIISRFPKVFASPSSTQRGENPVFRKEAAYTPFSKIISVMAMDKHQPLGNWHQCNATRVYDFFEVLTESILQAEQRAKS
jgi:hypothetical protein|nr:MAG TPA: hypothetical protein [Caudoviricetes sp.]